MLVGVALWVRPQSQRSAFLPSKGSLGVLHETKGTLADSLRPQEARLMAEPSLCESDGQPGVLERCIVRGKLYEVCGPGQGLLRGAGVILLAVKLCQLQDGHVAKGAHLADLQPLDEAPADGERGGQSFGPSRGCHLMT